MDKQGYEWRPNCQDDEDLMALIHRDDARMPDVVRIKKNEQTSGSSKNKSGDEKERKKRSKSKSSRRKVKIHPLDPPGGRMQDEMFYKTATSKETTTRTKTKTAQAKENTNTNTNTSVMDYPSTTQYNDIECASTPIIDYKDDEGFHLGFSRLYKTVEIKEAASGLVRSSIASSSGTQIEKKTTRVILNQVSGTAKRGEMLALMGPSGSGKTSLLNVLSGRSQYQSGVISINGSPIAETVTMKRLMSKIAYVKQFDYFFEHLTVRDQLTYTALLRLPTNMTKNDKHAEVNKIITSLGLTLVADTPVWLLSGGERKRVNIGTELLTDPYIILLDEPITGLDSTSAILVLRMMQSLARDQGKTVITSIHQPSSAVFRSFDRLLMLSEGSVVYHGVPIESLAYLERLFLPCPQGYNLADHWMDLLVWGYSLAGSTSTEPEPKTSSETEKSSNNQQDKEEESKHCSTGFSRRDTQTTTASSQWDGSSSEDNMVASQTGSFTHSGNDPVDTSTATAPPLYATTSQYLIASWDNEAISCEIDAVVKTASRQPFATRSKSVRLLNSTKKYNNTWTTQFVILTHRCLKNSKSAIFTKLNMIKSGAIGIVVGCLWFQLEYTEKTVFNRSSFFFFANAFWVFDSMFSALLTFPSERVVVFKERASASYQLSAYFMAKTVSDAPTRLVLPFIYMVISYWMAGINPRFVVFLGTTGCSLLSVLAGESLGLMVGASLYDMDQAVTLVTIIALGLMLLGGFYVNNVPVWVEWVKYLSPFKYAYDASLQLIFDEDTPCDGSGYLAVCEGKSEGYATSDEVLGLLGAQGSVGFNVGMLVLLALVTRYLAYRVLRATKPGDRW